MNNDIIESLKKLLATSSELFLGREAETKERFRKYRSLVESTLPESFKVTNPSGNPYTNPGGLGGQRIRKWFWLTGVKEDDEKNPVSLSAFLLKDKNGEPIIRESIEIRFNPQSKGKNQENADSLRQTYFQSRPTYVSALEISLLPDLSYWFKGQKIDDFNKSDVDLFVSDIDNMSHVEIVKIIELKRISDDDELQKEMKEGYDELLPYYEVAAGEKTIDEILNEHSELSLRNDPVPASKTEKTKEEPTKKNFKISRNLILFGPPGTGKTYHSIAYAEAIVKQDENLLGQLKKHQTIHDYEKLKNDFSDDLVEYDGDGKVKNGHICFTTFHQSYSYEDFIEGIFPDVSQDTGTIRYVLRAGVFKSLCDYAKQNSRENFVIIIDEINRGNVSKIFGDLITLIEEDKRIHSKNELTVTLPYSKEKWGVPDNVYIIGTMNTADRSIERLDTALRRRFSFVEMMPNPSLLNSYKNCLVSAPSDTRVLPLTDVLQAINERITFIYDRDHQIGHSYFLDIPESVSGFYALNDLAEVFRNKIIPLLQEYFYGNYQKIRFVLGISGKERDDQKLIVKKKAKFIYVNQNKDLLDDIDEDEESYEINDEGFDDINNYLRIIGNLSEKSNHEDLKEGFTD